MMSVESSVVQLEDEERTAASQENGVHDKIEILGSWLEWTENNAQDMANRLQKARMIRYQISRQNPPLHT